MVRHLGASGLDADDWIDRFPHQIGKRGCNLKAIHIQRVEINEPFSARRASLGPHGVLQKGWSQALILGSGKESVFW